MQEEKLSLVTLEGGAAVEMFDIALQKVLENIHDINTTDGSREINFKVKAKPMDEERSIIAYSITCPVKLCNQEPVMGTADLKVWDGKLGAFSRVTMQKGIPFSNVSSMNKPE